MNIRRKSHSETSEKPNKKRRVLRQKPAKLARFAREGARPKQTSENSTINFIHGGCEISSCRDETACVQYNDELHYCACTSNGEPAKEGNSCPRSTGSLSYLKKGLGVGRQYSTHTYAKQSSTGRLLEVNFIHGGCETSSCGAEAACVQYNDELHYCVCTSNGEPAKEGVSCPRSTVPLTQRQAIHNVIPPRPSNASETRASYAASPPPQGVNSQSSGEILTDATGTDSSFIGAGLYASTSAPFIISTVAGCAFLLILIFVMVFYLRRRICEVDRKVKQRVRPGEPLLADRYITNPQYGVCGAATAPLSAPGSPAPHHTAADDKEPEVTLLERSALTFLEEAGEGCFGKVHKGVLRVNNGEQVVAIKVLKDSAGRNAKEDFIREVSIMSAFRHSNILSLIGVVYRDDINASPWMVFEYMEWGDLAGVLRGSRGVGRVGPNIDDTDLLRIALQVAHGMQYLASRRFVHRDLAARNCLVGANLSVKIADFGMSRDVYTCDYYKMGGERPMPVRWMSPESIVYARFTHESDVWSYGVVLWEIYSRGKQPYYGCNNEDATKRIINGILLVPPEDCPQFACRLMRECWATDPRHRIGFDEICKKLEIAAASGGTNTQIRLPRPPPTPQDSTGYLIPTITTGNDYLKPLPDLDPDSESSEDEDIDDYT
ncbi:tyrosine-protein kinase transmembrane receptor Ror-like isoform X2 [Leptidea sinapis]|uniref:tyrosine-protein kinase transmembrane receptor Ror-like isoform X2 n=1 Tax=Leptidea sinapis TaxID=189913 RepID=UPI0021C36BC1|nr:tyrosine-protein kinase transmembrane receptor Ror-like isoform X2 [Leptidea sinapis]